MCGTSTGYRNGCRCDKCVKWRADYYRQGAEFDKRMRAINGMDVLVDAAPTARRLQALAVSGWSASMIGAELGLHYRNLTKIRSMDHPLVLTSTAVAVTTTPKPIRSCTACFGNTRWNTAPSKMCNSVAPAHRKKSRIC